MGGEGGKARGRAGRGGVVNFVLTVISNDAYLEILT